MTRFLGKYCSTELVNPERQKEVDFAKAAEKMWDFLSSDE